MATKKENDLFSTINDDLTPLGAKDIYDEKEKKANKSRRVIKEYSQDTIDNLTGEVVTSRKVLATVTAKSEVEFFKIFAENLKNLITNLTDPEIKVFFFAMCFVNWKNSFKADKGFLEEFEGEDLLSRATIYRALKGLKEKGVILEIPENTPNIKELTGLRGSKICMLNPVYIGRGSWKDLTLMRRSYVETFDRQKLSYQRELIVEAEYDGINEVKENPNQYEVKAIEQTKNSKENVTNILIEKKEQDDVIDVEDEPSIDQPNAKELERYKKENQELKDRLAKLEAAILGK